MSWLQEHFDTFVTPRSAEWRKAAWGDSYPCSQNFVKPEQMTLVKAAWRSAKATARKRTILLMGRDVWIFEVLARRENYPTVFDPSCSRQTCYHERFKKFDSSHVLLDTGFAGSIAKALKVDCILVSADRLGGVADKQIFPKLTGARTLALHLEILPKYWKSAYLGGSEGKVDGERLIIQEYSLPSEFAEAAALTKEVYKDSSPRTIAKRNPLGASKYMRYG